MTCYGTFESVMNTTVYQQDKMKKTGKVIWEIEYLKIYLMIRFQLLCVSKSCRVGGVSWQLIY